MNKKILVIDDDRKLNHLLTNYLTKFNFKVTTVTHPKDGLRLLKRELPDLIILDVMLPDMEGFEVCKEIRKEYSVPIIMLTARGEVTDRIVGLELGADDYLPKPFEPRELVARIQSVLRRISNKTKTELIQFKNLVVDNNKQAVFLEEQPVELTTMEFHVLSVFIRNSGIVLNRDQILEELKGMEWEPDNRSIDVLISRLRHKLKDDPKKPHFFKTVWGTGYMFIGEKIEES